jgi:hypothetical protein
MHVITVSVSRLFAMAPYEPFSKRNRYNSPAKEITVREDAPESLRFIVLDTARQLDATPSSLRTVLCRVLRVRPNDYNWSEFPNIWDEVQQLMYGCEWFKVYDTIEALHATFAERDDHDGGYEERAARFSGAINAFFVEEGIGWQLTNGQIVTRGTEAFEAMVTQATAALDAADRPTAAKHLHEALQDLSRRPDADLPGAVYHALGALECVARDVTGDRKGTLGELMKWYPGLLPKPLDEAVPKLWGFASNEARHIVEGRETNREEAELLVGLSAALAGYLTRKQQ